MRPTCIPGRLMNMHSIFFAHIHQDLISPMIVGRLIVAEVLIMDFFNDPKFAPAVLLKLFVI